MDFAFSHGRQKHSQQYDQCNKEETELAAIGGKTTWKDCMERPYGYKI